jgi:sporulation protein YqfC
MKKSKKNTLQRAVAATLPRLTIECIERYEVLIGGCKKIEAYSTEQTVVATHSCKVRVCGEELSIAFTGNGKIMLSGIIRAIEFE